jgi:hypothetical protein
VATQNVAAADAILKNYYRGPIVELLNQETFLIDQVEQTNANDIGTFTGRQIIFPVHTGRNRGRGGVTDGGTLAQAGKQSYLDGIVPPKYFNQAIEVSDMVIEQSATDAGAFVRVIDAEMSGAMQDLRKDISRMAYGTGDGLLATVSAASGPATTVAVDSGQYIAIGDTVDVLTKADGTVKGTALLVTNVVYTGTKNSATQLNATITLSGSVTVTTADGIYITGDRNNESDGLQNICNVSRILHQINSTTFPVWDSNVISAGQADPSEDLFIQLAQRIRLRAGTKGNGLDWFLSNLGVQRRLANTYQSQKRLNDAKVVDILGGYSAIMVAAGNKPIPVISDVDCPYGKVFAINKESLAWAELARPDWLEAPQGGGGILFLKDGATPGLKLAIWQGWIKWYATLVCTAPPRNGQITNLNDDVPIQRL